jgi:Gpi18-like mannosyltransferase
LVDTSFARQETVLLAGTLLTAFLARILLFPTLGCAGDMGAYVSWFQTAADHGVRSFYAAVGWCDYPPFNVYIFWVFGSLAKTSSAWGIDPTYIVKLTPVVFDLATVTLLFVFLRKYLTLKQSAVGAAIYAFNPAVIYDSAVWGQFDAIYTFLLVLSLMLAIKSKPKFAAAAFAISILTKPQGIALAPLLIYLIYRKNGLKKLLFSVGAFAATVFAVILPLEWDNPFTFLSNMYFGEFGSYSYTSVNAFNFWGLFGMWRTDTGIFYVGWALFGVFTALALYMLNKKSAVLRNWDFLAIYVAFMLFFAFFMWPTRIHERYLFPAVAMLALMFPLMKKTRVLYVGLTATFFVNLSYVLYWLNYSAYNNTGNLDISGHPVVLLVSIVNIVLFAYATTLVLLELRSNDGSYLIRSPAHAFPKIITQPEANGPCGNVCVVEVKDLTRKGLDTSCQDNFLTDTIKCRLKKGQLGAVPLDTNKNYP